MADPFSARPESFDVDESRPPTFVQVREAAPSTARPLLVILGIGVALVTALGWTAYQLAVQDAPVAMQAAPTVSETLPPQPAPADATPDLAGLSLDAAVSPPVWSRESLMDSISPFDASAIDRQVPSEAPPTDTRNTTQADSYEVSVRLMKGDTIESVLLDLGFGAVAVADAVSALAPHVKLKSLPIGLALAMRIRPPEKEGAKPILQALTVQSEGRREIRIERDDKGQLVPDRPKVR